MKSIVLSMYNAFEVLEDLDLEIVPLKAEHCFLRKDPPSAYERKKSIATSFLSITTFQRCRKSFEKKRRQEILVSQYQRDN